MLGTGLVGPPLSEDQPRRQCPFLWHALKRVPWNGHRHWLGNTGLTFATGCAVKDHGGDPGPEPAYRPAWPYDCAQSAKWLWTCGSGSSPGTLPSGHNVPALPAYASQVCWTWTFCRCRGIPRGWVMQPVQPT